MNRRGPVLVCFAVKEEAAPFRRLCPEDVDILVTGIGVGNASRAFLAHLERRTPGHVLTCGFAGGLDPRLRRGQVVFDADPDGGIADLLSAAGAVQGRFHGVDRVASTRLEKQRLRERTGADAVEMESFIIRTLCRERGLPSATVRVISDAADEDLPLDFNEVLAPDGRLKLARLAWRVARSPGLVADLVALRKTTQDAARRLALVLRALVSTTPRAA